MRALAAALVLLAACSGKDIAPSGDFVPPASDGGSSGPGHEGDPCAAPADCVPGLTCTARKCAKDTSPFCTTCAIDHVGAGFCAGEGTIYCLTETVNGAAHNYCGKDCADDSECPSGASCNAILIPRGETCTTTTACPASDKTCASDADCPGGACDKGLGKCRPTCVGASGNSGGSCGCVSDGDCPTDTCDSQTGRCTVSAHHCDAAHPCPVLTCQQHASSGGGSVGYCRVGRNCAPSAGLTCADLGH